MGSLGKIMAATNTETNDFVTPQDLFDSLNEQFHFTIDVASTDENAKCERHYTKEQDALSQNWDGERCWMNPPYGKYTAQWVKKASEAKGGIVVGLLPVRTDTGWFHDYVLGQAEIVYIRGRLHFSGAKYAAPFPSMICIWEN